MITLKGRESRSHGVTLQLHHKSPINGLRASEVSTSQISGLEPGLELPPAAPGMPGISQALVTLVPGTAAAKAIPAEDTIYPRLCETACV